MKDDAQVAHRECWYYTGNCVLMKSVTTEAAGGRSDALSSTDALEEARGWGREEGGGCQEGATHWSAL